MAALLPVDGSLQQTETTLVVVVHDAEAELQQQTQDQQLIHAC
jgi:hypothetical protein